MGKIIRGYKGFERDFTCRGMQYEVGKTYEIEGEPKLCERGFHFCTSPLAVFKYYEPTKRFAIVEADEADVVCDNDFPKAVAKRLTIVREVTLDEMVRLQMGFASRKERSIAGGEMCRLGYEHLLQEKCSLTATGESSIVGVMGGSDYSVSVNGNYAASVVTDSSQSVASCYGFSTVAATTGVRSIARAGGACSAAVATNINSVAMAAVGGAVAVVTDDNSIAVVKSHATAVCTGYNSVAISKECESLAVAAGEQCSASGVLGSWLVLVEREYSQICDVRVVRVDGKDIKEGVRYELVDGKIQKA